MPKCSQNSENHHCINNCGGTMSLQDELGTPFIIINQAAKVYKCKICGYIELYAK